eukprot:scaffold91703_cov53-Attheya_sp.AAC.6
MRYPGTQVLLVLLLSILCGWSGNVAGAFTVPAVCSGSRNPSRGVLTNVEDVVWQTSSLRNTEQDSSNDLGSNVEKKKIMPDLLLPFPPAADPMYMCRGPVGEKQFILTREGPPTPEELSNENLLRILRIECSDLEANTLVWKCLGYRFDASSESWLNDEVFPKWRGNYPSPPDLIGMQRIYSKEVDRPSLKANQSIVRSIPADNKQSLKTHLKPYGFTGYKNFNTVVMLCLYGNFLDEQLTRRAQCANWLLFYREELFGYSVEELRERRRLKNEAEEAEKRRIEAEQGKTDEEWKPPVKEVF